jgi:prevent-host-death family protein
MHLVNMHEAKTNLSALVEDVASGRESEVVIARNGVPAVRLVPLQTVDRDCSGRIGIASHKYRLPDTFEATNGEIADLLEGKTGDEAAM